MDCPTTRRFPRTLEEAFPSDVKNAYAIECWRSDRLLTWAGDLLALLVICSMGALLGAAWAL